jgi:hypothetical protein
MTSPNPFQHVQACAVKSQPYVSWLHLGPAPLDECFPALRVARGRQCDAHEDESCSQNDGSEPAEDPQPDQSPAYHLPAAPGATDLMNFSHRV